MNSEAVALMGLLKLIAILIIIGMLAPVVFFLLVAAVGLVAYLLIKIKEVVEAVFNFMIKKNGGGK